MGKGFIEQFTEIVDKFDDYILNIEKKDLEDGDWKLLVKFKGGDYLNVLPQEKYLKTLQDKCIEIFTHYNGPFPEFKDQIFEFVDGMESYKYRVFWTGLELGLVYVDHHKEVAINIFVSNYFYPEEGEESKSLSIVINQERYNGSNNSFRSEDPKSTLLSVVKKILKEKHKIDLK